MKSANCISATGRMPISEAPVQAPTMAVSASGASSTRHGPNSAWKPCGDLEGAAVDADVLADHEHALVAAHLLAEAVRDRLQIGLDRHPLPVMRGVEIFRRRPDAVAEGRGVGERALFRAAEGVDQQRLDLLAEPGVLVVAEAVEVRLQPGTVALERVGAAPMRRAAPRGT